VRALPAVGCGGSTGDVVGGRSPIEACLDHRHSACAALLAEVDGRFGTRESRRGRPRSDMNGGWLPWSRVVYTGTAAGEAVRFATLARCRVLLGSSG
jgi:hypothetical protein